MSELNFVELFAGCGGLSLGLKSAGFELVFANELSPMAAETYAYNFFNEDLTLLAKAQRQATKTLWISSAYPATDVSNRLRENPFVFPENGEGFCDLTLNSRSFEGVILVGNLIHLNRWLQKNPRVLGDIKNLGGSRGVDLLSGGPPCQSFSMAGLREKDSDKNTLPWEFATFAQSLNPKIVLLENVSGIFRPFKSASGEKYYAWFEIARAFVQVGYVPICLHVNAKFVGVPQNRPRFILIGIRHDLMKELTKTLNDLEKEILSRSLDFFEKIKNKENVSLDDLNYWDVTRDDHKIFFDNSFLKPLLSNNSFASVESAIDDLRIPDQTKSAYAKEISNLFKKFIKNKALANHDFRTNSDLVRRRFRLYQVLNDVSRSTKSAVLSVLNGKNTNLSDEAWREIAGFKFLRNGGQMQRFSTKYAFTAFLVNHKTKKRMQRALVSCQPAPATLSIPDDACHYHPNELRTLSVREMARVQSFPDQFEFRSKVTTGGKLRCYEVPQYTQVGNAVPPLLGRALGLVVSDLLARVNVCE